MKKTLICLIGILVACSAFADTVDKSTAETIARRWLGTEVTQVQYASDAFYIFNGKDGGWVMVSADDTAVPIIGYSETGRIDPSRTPVNFKNWVGIYEDDIKYAREQKVARSLEVAASWKTAGYRTKASSGKLITTPAWGQDSPFNNDCPKVTENGSTYTAVTGCVATAMAEVIRYHQWPEHGTGTIGGYSYTSDYKKKVSISSYSIDDHTYDYSLMPYNYGYSSTSAQNAAVAQLMHDCGVMVEANYNYGTGTGAYSENIVPALSEHMGYSASAQLIYRQAYSDVEWTKLIEIEIDNDRPILYAGGGDDGGHQFVCDGYDTKDYIHINWGWTGDHDGYFTLSLKIPGAYSFPDDQSMVIGLVPDKEGDDIAKAGPIIFDCYNSDSKGLSVTSGSILSKSFKVSADALSNMNYKNDYNGALKVGLVNYLGELKEYVSGEVSASIQAFYTVMITDISCSISGDVTFGDRIVLYYKTSDGNWEQVYGKEGVDYSVSTYPTYQISDSVPAVDAAYILVPESFSAGDTFFFELIPGLYPIESITWYYDGTKQAGVSANLTSGTHTVTAEVEFTDGTEETITTQLIVK